MTAVSNYPDISRFPVRAAGFAGLAAGAILLVNAGKRAGVLPASHVTQLIAPIAEVLAVLFVVGLAITAGVRSRRGVVAVAVNVAALAALVGVEFVINLVFAQVSRGQAAALLDGPLGLAITAVSVAFLLGSLAFVAALWGTGAVPRVPLVGYGLAAVPISMRAFVPEAVLDAGLVLLALSVVWLSAWMVRRVSPSA